VKDGKVLLTKAANVTKLVNNGPQSADEMKKELPTEKRLVVVGGGVGGERCP